MLKATLGCTLNIWTGHKIESNLSCNQLPFPTLSRDATTHQILIKHSFFLACNKGNLWKYIVFIVMLRIWKMKWCTVVLGCVWFICFHRHLWFLNHFIDCDIDLHPNLTSDLHNLANLITRIFWRTVRVCCTTTDRTQGDRILPTCWWTESLTHKCLNNTALAASHGGEWRIFPRRPSLQRRLIWGYSAGLPNADSVFRPKTLN